MEGQNQNTAPIDEKIKFCRYCGQKVNEAAVVCPHCGCQIEEIKSQAESSPQIVINNANHNSNVNTNVAAGLPGRLRNKWVAFCLCLLLGFAGAHKFYESKIGLGILYLFTGGLFGMGWLIDTIVLLFKPNPYYI